MAFQHPKGLDRLNYLDLHGELKLRFEIKLSAEFLFEKRQGYFCLFPAIQTSVQACEVIKTQPEMLMLDKIHTLFSSTIAPEVCQRWFSWETVELPEGMLQRLAALDEHERKTLRIHSFQKVFHLEPPYLLSLPLTPRRAPAKEHNLVGVLPTSHTPHNSKKITKVATSTVREHESEAELQPSRPPPFIVAPSSPALKSQGAPVQQRSSNSDAKVTQRHRSKRDEPLHEPTTGAKVQAPNLVRITQGNEQGISITNHIYLTADPRLTEGPSDAWANRVSACIHACLKDLKIPPMTTDEIWKCIEQKGGYEPFTWQAILAKLDIPEDRMSPILTVMANASNHYLSKFQLGHVVSKLSAAQKAERRARLEALTTALDSAKSGYAQEAIDITETHGRSLKWTRSQLFLKSRLLQQQQAQLKEANEDREKGEHFKLMEFIAQNKTELLHAYSKLTFAQKQVYKGQILKARENKQQTTQANPKAVQHDMNASMASMDREWMALCARTGTEGFYIAVRGGIEDLSEPKIFFTQKVEKFIEDILHMEPQHLALKLESYVISGLDEGVTP
ncbi:hypothetical protein DFH29DRAFT_880018 [Suillus ampliporus]|nr:hypothetical protein DFH29DRAFT_880018 [Suillus ampliporus]